MRAVPAVFFSDPTTAIVSLLYVSEGGASTELAVIGHEGMTGISLLMGGNAMPYQAEVQNQSLGLRLRARLVNVSVMWVGITIFASMFHNEHTPGAFDA